MGEIDGPADAAAPSAAERRSARLVRAICDLGAGLGVVSAVCYYAFSLGFHQMLVPLLASVKFVMRAVSGGS